MNDDPGDSVAQYYPDPQESAFRALCLFAVLYRGSFEAAWASATEEERASYAEAVESINNWVATGFLQFLSPREAQWLGLDAGAWPVEAQAESSWQVEPLAVMLWAGGLVEQLAPYDQAHDYEQLGTILSARINDPRFAADFTLRPVEDIEKARDSAELWHWRARTMLMSRGRLTAVPAAPDEDWDKVVETAAQDLLQKGRLTALIGGDFPAFGKPYRDLDDRELAYVSAIAELRHKALNWLCGYNPAWDDVPTDT